MTEFPTSLEQAIAQATAATNAALADGYTRLQVEILIFELKPQLVAEQFLPEFSLFGSQLKLFFPDAGAAALARRDWGDVPFKIMDVGTGRVPPEVQIQPEDQSFLFIEPSTVEVKQVEKLCELAQERPVVMLNPRLEDPAIIGIGYAGRQLRDRFLNNIESCYHLRPLEGAAVFRCYPSPWQVWRETDDDYQLIVELPRKPSGEELERIVSGATRSSQSSDASAPKKPGIFAPLQKFLRSLSR